MTEIKRLLGGIAVAALLAGSAFANGTPPQDAKEKDASASPKTSCSGGEKANTSCSGGEKARASQAAEAKSTDAAAKPKTACSGGEKTTAGSSCGKGSCS
jgi:hypothetical protein